MKCVFTYLWYSWPLRRHFLFPQKKVTKENSRRRLLLLKLVLLLLVWLPNQTMPV